MNPAPAFCGKRFATWHTNWERVAFTDIEYVAVKHEQGEIKSFCRNPIPVFVFCRVACPLRKKTLFATMRNDWIVHSLDLSKDIFLRPTVPKPWISSVAKSVQCGKESICITYKLVIFDEPAGNATQSFFVICHESTGCESNLSSSR